MVNKDGIFFPYIIVVELNDEISFTKYRPAITSPQNLYELGFDSAINGRNQSKKKHGK